MLQDINDKKERINGLVEKLTKKQADIENR